MFITQPQHFQNVPTELAGPGLTYWRQVTLSISQPWYICDYVQEFRGRKILKTALVSWESTLVELLTAMNGRCQSVSMICKSFNKNHSTNAWGTLNIDSVWILTGDENDDRQGVYFKHSGKQDLFDEQMNAVKFESRMKCIFSSLSD